MTLQWTPQTLELDSALGPQPLCVSRTGNGPAIIAVHGVLVDHLSWEALAEQLQTRFTIYAVDLPGHGANPGALGLCNQPERIGELLAALPRALGLDRPGLLAHSYGALCGLHALVRAPETFRAAALIAPPALPYRAPMLAQVFKLGRVGRALVRKGYRASAFRHYFGHDVYGGAALSESQNAQLVRYYQRFRSPLRQDVLVRTLAAAVAPSLDETALASLKLGVDILWGAHDRVVPSHVGRQLIALLPEGELSLLGAAGHACHETHPAETLQELERRFLPSLGT